MNRAIADVLAERRRHIEVEGWTPAHDDAHADGELEKAAACYAMHTPSVKNLQRQKVKLWPWSPDWWKPDLGRRDLVKAGALILAAIERIDRRDGVIEVPENIRRALLDAGDRRDWDEVDRLERIVDNGTTTPREWKRDNDATWCLLNLTGEGACVPESAIAAWTDEQCRQAEEWAGAAHLNASDNDDVVVPPIPEHVKVHDTPENQKAVLEGLFKVPT